MKIWKNSNNEVYISYFDFLLILEFVYLNTNRFELKCGTSKVRFLSR